MPDTNIPMDQWGRDHWSAFAYIETCVVDHGGEPDVRRMRTDPWLHPNMGPREPVGGAGSVDGSRYPTRLYGGAVASPHDDWSCLDDAEAAGLVENVGSGMYRRYRLTELGLEVAAALRAHKARGSSFGTFRPEMPPAAASSECPLCRVAWTGDIRTSHRMSCSLTDSGGVKRFLEGYTLGDRESLVLRLRRYARATGEEL